MRDLKLGASLLVLLLFSCELSAQLTAGSVVGSVTDPTGALVPGAQISLTQRSTGAALSAVSSSQGVFSFPVVPVGTYTFSATTKGFKTATGDLEVELNTTRTLNVRLNVGASTETINITEAGAP